MCSQSPCFSLRGILSARRGGSDRRNRSVGSRKWESPEFAQIFVIDGSFRFDLLVTCKVVYPSIGRPARRGRLMASQQPPACNIATLSHSLLSNYFSRRDHHARHPA